ncbi:exonuclease domain-containing protein [Demequina sp.]|uniref:exonuclease domain-containing protein n=1 Tax=Demequina sp. TaxID=2050685 RepID=UPI0025C2389C|nr:exonuclease domain-containing protein [Demequina sp.]
MGLDFLAVDVETANSNRGSICAFGYSIVRDSEVISGGSWLCQPPRELDYFEPMNMSIHGIRPDDVAGLPRFGDRLEEITDLAAGFPLIAHNAGFDMGAMRAACAATPATMPEFDYVCTLVLARRMLNLPSNRLPFVCRDLGIEFNRHHDAGADADGAARVAIALAARADARSLDELLGGNGVRMGRTGPTAWQPSHAIRKSYGEDPASPETNTAADPSNPFYGEVVVFTGGLAVPRPEAWQRIADLGAIAQKGVNKHTTLLVIGGGFTGHNPDDFATGKALAAAKWRDKGHKIEVLNEVEFWDRLDEAESTRR